MSEASQLEEADLAALRHLAQQGDADEAAWAAEWAAMSPAEQQAHRAQFASLGRKMQSSVGGTAFDQ